MGEKSSLSSLAGRLRRGPNDVTGIDETPSGVCVVRMRKTEASVAVVAAEILPPVRPVGSNASPPPEIGSLLLPQRLRGKHGALAVSGRDAVVKLLRLPATADLRDRDNITSRMGLQNPADYRIGFKALSEGHGKTEAKVLAVALPERDAALLSALLPSGRPVPCCLEVSGLAAMTSFMRGPGSRQTKESWGALYVGPDFSWFALFNQEVLSLIRRFDFGTDAVLDKVQTTLGVDVDTARGIVHDGAFDISHLTTETVAPLVNQIVLSRDFVERRENCHVTSLHVSGALIMTEDILKEIRSATDVQVEVLNPFDGLAVQPGALTDEAAENAPRFAAAVGACLGVLEPV
jgi:Tfp pilus assembly PilM family ATPase